MDYIGFDLGKVSSQVCIITEDGELIEIRLKTNREQLSRLFGIRSQARILIEASTESEWVARYLEELGHDVIVADTNFAPMYATRSRRVKTDKRDARTLAEACRLGAYRQAHRTSDKQRHVRAQLAVREAMVRTRAKYISLICTLLRRDGYRIASGTAPYFLKRLEQIKLTEELCVEIAPLVALLTTLNEQIKAANNQLAQLVKEDEVVARLCTLPGVGPVTATSFSATLDEVKRFDGAKQVRAYLGLVPREYSSGERQQRGGISKAGPSRARSMLVEAAWTILRQRKESTETLHVWATRIAQRRGRRIAVVALARKLAGILFAMWRDGTSFAPQLLRPNSAVTDVVAA
jgi:transposase